MPHVGVHVQLGVRDGGRGGDSTGHVDQPVIESVDDRGGDVKVCEEIGAIAASVDGGQLPVAALWVVAAVDGGFGVGPDPLVRVLLEAGNALSLDVLPDRPIAISGRGSFSRAVQYLGGGRHEGGAGRGVDRAEAEQPFPGAST